jgi:hypothetical protein
LYKVYLGILVVATVVVKVPTRRVFRHHGEIEIEIKPKPTKPSPLLRGLAPWDGWPFI